jgi:hypothetical protein
VLLATTILFATPVAAENLTDLIALAEKLNELCRGLPVTHPALMTSARLATWLSLTKGYALEAKT